MTYIIIGLLVAQVLGTIRVVQYLHLIAKNQVDADRNAAARARMDER